MLYEELKTPQDLMTFLDANISYGVLVDNKKIYSDSFDENFQKVCLKNWQLRDVSNILKSGIGHCYDEVEIERDWFSSHNFLFKTFWVYVCDKKNKDIGFSHSYLVYYENKKWNLFEHADYLNKGIYTFNNLEDAIKFQTNNQIKLTQSNAKTHIQIGMLITEFEKPKIGLDIKQYINFVSNSKIVKN